jgi:hypothetical protein
LPVNFFADFFAQVVANATRVLDRDVVRRHCGAY